MLHYTIAYGLVAVAGPGLKGVSLPDFFRGVVAYLPQTAGWAAKEPPLDYRSVLRMLVAHGAEVQTKSGQWATHLVCCPGEEQPSAGRGSSGGAATDAPAAAAVAEWVARVDAGWVHACHIAQRQLPAPAAQVQPAGRAAAVRLRLAEVAASDDPLRWS